MLNKIINQLEEAKYCKHDFYQNGIDQAISIIKAHESEFEALQKDSNLSKEFIEWRDKYFDKNIKVLEWKSKKNGKRFTSLELYDIFNKAMLGETLHLQPKL